MSVSSASERGHGKNFRRVWPDQAENTAYDLISLLGSSSKGSAKLPCAVQILRCLREPITVTFVQAQTEKLQVHALFPCDER